MRAARQFVLNLQSSGMLSDVHRIKIELYGSLALTGKGHSTDIAVLLGAEGNAPETTNPKDVEPRVDWIREHHQISLLNSHLIHFEEESDLIFHYDKQLPFHPNGMRFTVFRESGKELAQEIFYSVGGGFIVDHHAAMKDDVICSNDHQLPYPFKTAEQLLDLCKKHDFTIAELMWENEKSWRTVEEIEQGLLNIWHVMQDCVKRGCEQEGILPGGLNVKRRAAGIYRYLQTEDLKPLEERDPAEVMDWVSLWALAVNEENAAGGRVVTAPTNGASGVIPAVLHYYERFVKNSNSKGIITFLLVAGAIGILYKEGASISAAEMGCMGEVGVACSMAAAGLAAALGASNEQIENAAEIGMEHNLGLTCDPIKGLVQIPCIERNTMGAAKAINAERLARLHGDGTHRVTLDQVIATMKQTGHDMMAIYKETSQGGLAVNVPEC
jgi:L-serine dehydratase